MNKRAALFGGLWVLSIAATAWITAYWRTRAPESPTLPGVEPAPISTGTLKPSLAPTHTAQAAEIEQLRAQIAALELERTQQGKRYLTLSLEKWADNGGRIPATEGDAQKIWDDLYAFQENNSGLGAIAGSIRFAIRLLSLGDAGASYLGKIMNDPERDSEDRAMALEMLSMLCTPGSYRELLRFQSERFPENDFPYEAYIAHLENLPTDQAREGFKSLINRIRRDLESGENPGGWTVDLIGQLAFIHGDGQARLLLGDRRLMRLNVSRLIQLAQASGNSEARYFIEQIAREHTDPSLREQAQVALDSWGEEKSTPG